MFSWLAVFCSPCTTDHRCFPDQSVSPFPVWLIKLFFESLHFDWFIDTTINVGFRCQSQNTTGNKTWDHQGGKNPLLPIRSIQPVLCSWTLDITELPSLVFTEESNIWVLWIVTEWGEELIGWHALRTVETSWTLFETVAPQSACAQVSDIHFYSINVASWS